MVLAMVLTLALCSVQGASSDLVPSYRRGLGPEERRRLGVPSAC